LKKNRGLRKKKSVALPSALPCCHGCSNEKICPPAFWNILRDLFFSITEGIGVAGVSFYFWPQKQILSGRWNTNFWLLFSLLREILTNFYVLSLIWGLKLICGKSRMAYHLSEILCWAQKVYFMGSDIQPGVMSAQKSEIQIIRVT
jgi:hypothetical protein